jgi:hypothetical protein
MRAFHVSIISDSLARSRRICEILRKGHGGYIVNIGEAPLPLDYEFSHPNIRLPNPIVNELDQNISYLKRNQNVFIPSRHMTDALVLTKMQLLAVGVLDQNKLRNFATYADLSDGDCIRYFKYADEKEDDLTITRMVASCIYSRPL